MHHCLQPMLSQFLLPKVCSMVYCGHFWSRYSHHSALAFHTGYRFRICVDWTVLLGFLSNTTCRVQKPHELSTFHYLLIHSSWPHQSVIPLNFAIFFIIKWQHVFIIVPGLNRIHSYTQMCTLEHSNVTITSAGAEGCCQMGKVILNVLWFCVGEWRQTRLDAAPQGWYTQQWQDKSHEITETQDDPLQSAGTAGKVLRSERLQIYVLVMVLIEWNTGYRRKKMM